MAKVKYYYDSENLAYRKIKTKIVTKFGYVALFLLASALFGFLCFLLILNTPFLETPKDRLLTRELDNYELQYALLNKRINQLDEAIATLEERDNNVYRVYFNTSPIPVEQRRVARRPRWFERGGRRNCR